MPIVNSTLASKPGWVGWLLQMKLDQVQAQLDGLYEIIDQFELFAERCAQHSERAEKLLTPIRPMLLRIIADECKLVLDQSSEEAN